MSHFGLKVSSHIFLESRCDGNSLNAMKDYVAFQLKSLFHIMPEL